MYLSLNLIRFVIEKKWVMRLPKPLTVYRTVYRTRIKAHGYDIPNCLLSSRLEVRVPLGAPCEIKKKSATRISLYFPPGKLLNRIYLKMYIFILRCDHPWSWRLFIKKLKFDLFACFATRYSDFAASFHTN